MLKFPIIDKQIADIAPDFRAISILVDATNAGQGSMGPNLLEEACDLVQAGGPAWSEAHLSGWNEVYARFGAKPNRNTTLSSLRSNKVIKTSPVFCLERLAISKYLLNCLSSKP